MNLRLIICRPVGHKGRHLVLIKEEAMEAVVAELQGDWEEGWAKKLEG